MNQNQIDALTAIADMAVRFSHRARANDASAFEVLAKEIRSVADVPSHDAAQATDGMFSGEDNNMLRKALVTARRVEIGHEKTAVKHLDDAAEQLAKKQAKIYSGLITKIDDARK